jgi:hypothetical protein
MRVAYLTTDAVNQDWAVHRAAEDGVTVHPLALDDPPPDGQFDAVVYDWDYLPPQRRAQFLLGLLAGPLSCPAAVHSYNLEEDHIKALRRHGVAVSSWLESDLFQKLRQAAERWKDTLVRFGYVTVEDNNWTLAVQTAKDCGAKLHRVSPTEARPERRFDAVLYDWDGLAPQRRVQLLLGLLAGPSPCPVAVHSGQVDQEEGEALCRNGVAVYPRLEIEVFRRLRRAVCRW